MAESLKTGNDEYAFTFAKRCIPRFLMRFLDLRSHLAAIKTQHPDDDLDELSCLYILLCDKVSPTAAEILKQAFSRYQRYQHLAEHVNHDVANEPTLGKRFAETEASILRAILDFELSTNLDPSWNFETAGLRQLRDDFLLLIEYLKPWQTQSLEQICKSWASFFLSPAQHAEMAPLPEHIRARLRFDALKPVLRPFWFFFVALCHVLQEGENELTPHDCYWLGLIDEVIGDTSLSSLRQLVEFSPSF